MQSPTPYIVHSHLIYGNPSSPATESIVNTASKSFSTSTDIIASSSENIVSKNNTINLNPNSMMRSSASSKAARVATYALLSSPSPSPSCTATATVASSNAAFLHPNISNMKRPLIGEQQHQQQSRKVSVLTSAAPMKLRIRPSTKTETTSVIKRHLSKASSSEEEVNQISSSRGRNAVSLLPTYLTDARSVTKFHPIDAPFGALQLSVAENQMLEDLLVPALSRFSSSTTKSSSDEEMMGLFRSDQIYYQPTHGRPGLRKAMSSYLQRVLKLPKNGSLDEDGLVLGAGCNAVLENLCFCLTEPGDAVLLPTPYYAAFEFDLVARAALNIIPVNTMEYQNNNTKNDASSTSIPPSAYYPNRESLEAAYHKAKLSGAEPKVLLLSHPNNPLGICYPPSVVKECINWARERHVHLISDEIYAGSVYRETNADGSETFQSALTLAAGHVNNNISGPGLGLGPYIHFVYALSKDFALSGLRVGVAYSENEAIRLPMQKLNDLCQISSQTQLTVEEMLSASRNNGELSSGGEQQQLWSTDEFLPQNQERIRSRSDSLLSCLTELNIPFLNADSGLFVWMDMREFLPPVSDGCHGKETNESMDKRERTLYLEMLQQYGLLFTPGRSMRNELPGFFRCVFTAASEQEFDLGLQRIRAFVEAKRNA